MAWLFLALAGLPVGVVLDAVAVRLAQPVSEAAARRGNAGAVADTDERRAGSAGGTWVRRLLIVAATATLFGIAGGRFDHVGHLAIVTAYVAVLVLCAVTDLSTMRVPNVVTYPAILGALALGFTMPGAGAKDVLAGGALAGGIFLVPALLTGGVGTGMGDVKLATFVGLSLGLAHTVTALLATALIGGAGAGALLLTGARRRGDVIPYAPFIAAGALIALLWRGTAFVGL